MTCLYSTQYSMQADIYEEYSQVNKQTGQKIKDWQFVKTVRCDAQMLNTTPSRSEYERYDTGTYQMDEAILFKTSEKLSSSSRIANIRMKNVVLWEENDSTPSIFEIVVSHPIVGPFEAIIGYQLVCTRSTDQRIYP